jgi:hypothetical protein
VNVKVDPSGALTTSSAISSLPNEGQQTMANSISVAIASNQTAVPVSGTFYQATQPVSATDLDIRDLTSTDVVTVTGGAGQTADVKVTLDGESVPVTGTFYQATQPVSATDLDIRNLAKAQDEVYSVLKTDAGVAYDARLVTAQANSGVDIGDVTINNASGASAVNVQDGGNSLTIDAPVATPVFVRLSDGAAAITTLPVSLASVPSHAVTATDLDIRNLAKANDEIYTVLRTDAGVAYDARLVTAQANSGVDIGDVTINNAAGAAAVNIQDGGNTITVDGTVSANATLTAETTKVIGTVNVSTGQTITDVPATTGGLSKFHLVGAATTNQTNVKASAGQVYAITAFNVAATPAYLKFHNTAGTPTAGSGVTDTFLIPGNTAGAGMVINIDKGITFATGIAITLVTGIADADTTAIAASNVVVNIYYR